MDHCSGAHHAWLEGAVHRCAGQSIGSQRASGFAQGNDLRVRRRIVCQDRLVEAARHNLVFKNNHSADRNFACRLRFCGFSQRQIHVRIVELRVHDRMLHCGAQAMKLVFKLAFFLILLPATLFAQPGVRMSADFLPLEVGNRWVYDVFNEAGQKIGNVEFGVVDYRIVGGRSFYGLTHFPFVTEGDMIKFVRYDRQERTYTRMLDNEEGPLFLADGTRVDILQTDESNLPSKFILHTDLVDLTFQRGMGIIEARMHSGKDVEIAKLSAFRTTDKQAAVARAEGAPVVPASPTAPQPKPGESSPAQPGAPRPKPR